MPRSFPVLTVAIAVIVLVSWTAAATAVLLAPEPDPVHAVALIVIGLLGAACCLRAGWRRP